MAYNSAWNMAVYFPNLILLTYKSTMIPAVITVARKGLGDEEVAEEDDREFSGIEAM
jgi:hypothetical protein